MSLRLQSPRGAYIGIACALAGSIAFSAKPVLVKAVYQYGVDTTTLLALRMLFAAPLFALMAWWAGRPAVAFTGREIAGITALGFLGYYLGSLLDLAGLQHISAGFGRLILYLYPTLVLLMSAMFLKQPLRAPQLVSLGLSYAGIALVFSAETRLGDDPGVTVWGAALVFGSAVTYATYLVAGSRLVHKFGSMRFSAYASLIATGFVIAHFLALRPVHALVVAGEVYALVAVLAVFATVLPLWLMAEGLKRIGANQVSLVGCIGPLATLAFAWAFLGEAVTLTQLAGATLVLAGVLLISLKPQAA
ncbi:MAG: DMT family transporter [Betaproteobacteria bacterium]|nr:MAG: DMT family transporter [Betaproteobacteria bacterium]